MFLDNAGYSRSRYGKRFVRSFQISCVGFLLQGQATAQIIPDTTLPTTSTVPISCTNCTITGGTAAERNLFHSFSQFSVPLNGEAYFDNALDIDNIISRITGDGISNIEGGIRANGSANLFLINPNGIIFGEQASLNIGGSFLGTTAEAIAFEDATQFNARQTSPPTQLTVSAPLGLQFGSNPAGTIINRSNASPGGAVNAVGSVFGLGALAPVGLQAFPGRTLALVGSAVDLQGGNITAPGGRVEIGSVSNNSFIEIEPNASGWQLNYDSVPSFSDISLSDFALVDTSDPSNLAGGVSGAISLYGQNISLAEASQILALNFGNQSGQPINLQASESITIEDVDFSIGQNSSVVSLTFGPADAASLEVKAKNLTLTEGASLGSGTIGPATGNTGTVNLEIEDIIEVSGGVFPSTLLVQVVTPGTEGNGSALNIQTGELHIQEGSQVSAITFGAGDAGEINIVADREVKIDGFIDTPTGVQPSSILSIVSEGASGNSGTINIETARLIATQGGQISNRVLSAGQGNTLQVTATESVVLNGFAPVSDGVVSDMTLENRRSGIFSSADPAYIGVDGSIVETTGDSGSLTVNTPLLIVEEGARISADTFGSGRGGNATINVAQLTVKNGGEIRAASLLEEGFTNLERGAGGTLVVNASELVEIFGTGQVGSFTSSAALITDAQGTGPAGNLIIREAANSDLSVVLRNGGQVSANTVSSTGGNVLFEDVNVVLLRSDSSINAEAGSALGEGDGGNVVFSMPDGFILAVPNENNDIVANAFSGTGGNINITAQNIIGLDQRRATPGNITNDIDASSEFGTSGTVAINNLEFDPTQGLIQLPTDPAPPTQVAERCLADSKDLSAFVITGQGGASPSPRDIVRNATAFSTNADTRTDTAIGTPTNEPNTSLIIEAQGWQKDSSGEVVLMAQAEASQTQTFQALSRSQYHSCIHPTSGQTPSQTIGQTGE